MEAVQNAKPYYEKALEIDPQNYDAHLLKGQMHLWYEWDFEAAEREIQIGKQLNPGLRSLWLLESTGRFGELLKSAEQTLEIDPLSPYAWSFKILGLYHTGQQEQAIKTIDESKKLYDIIIDVSGLYVLTMSYVEVYTLLGMYNEVIEIIEPLLNESTLPEVKSSLAISYFHIGLANRSNELINEIKNSHFNLGASPSYHLAQVYAQMGDIESAFESLETAYSNHEV